MIIARVAAELFGHGSGDLFGAAGRQGLSAFKPGFTAGMLNIAPVSTVYACYKKYRDAVVSAVFNNGGAGRNSSCSAFYI